MTRAFAATAGGVTIYDQVEYLDGDTVFFGSESKGLSDDIIAKFAPDSRIKIPMKTSNRSINLSNAVSLVVYEMWRQQSFAGSDVPTPDSEPYFS
jgi:tRNA (cytidine/uridine-2'-O-)-methyltransferase